MTAEPGIFSLAGFTRLVDRVLESGRHEAFWNGTMAGGDKAPSGFYFCRLSTADRAVSRKMVLLPWT